MNGYLAHLIHNSGRYRRWCGGVAVVLLAAGWGGLWLTAQHRRQPPHAKQRYQTVYDHATQICSVLGSTCDIDPRPMFNERKTRCYASDNTPLRMWKFFCLVDGRPTWLVFNDDTAGLCYLIAERTHQLEPEKLGPSAINTKAEAAEAGFQRLKAMKLLRPGMLAALREQPHMNPIHNTWMITYAVKPNANAAPYLVRISLDRATGVPLALANSTFMPEAIQSSLSRTGPSHS
jgi:hypothetical protein